MTIRERLQHTGLYLDTENMQFYIPDFVTVSMPAEYKEKVQDVLVCDMDPDEIEAALHDLEDLAAEDPEIIDMLTIQRINDLAKSLYDDYNLIGIRIQNIPFDLGEMDHVSHVWEDGNDTGEELDGVCAIDITSRYTDWTTRLTHYIGDHVAVICGNIGHGGEDIGEIVIEDPVVVDILS